MRPIRKKYQVGELAKLLGISSQMIRNYEKKGLLSPSRLDSNYRSYEAPDLTLLFLLRKYRAFGYSLDEIKELVTQDSESLLDQETQLLAQIDQEIERLCTLKQYVNQEISALEEYHRFADGIRMETMPHMRGFFYRDNRTLNRSIFHSSQFASIAKEIPPLIYMICFSPEILESNDAAYKVGFIETAQTHAAFPKEVQQMETDDTVDYVTLYLTHVTHKENGEWATCDITNDFRESGVLQYLEENGLRVAGNIIGFKVFDKYDARSFTHSFKYWIPVLTLKQV